MQTATSAVKAAFRTNPIKRKLKILVDWIQKGDTPGVVTGGEWDATYFSKDNVNNNETYAQYKPFIFSESMRFGDNVRFLSTKYENGYLSANRSDASGVYASAEVVSMIYTATHATSNITIIGSQFNYPVNFDLYYRDATNTSWVLCANYINLTNYLTIYTFASATVIKGWKLEITKINLTDMLACIIEVQIGFRDDVTTDIIDFEVRKELEYTSEKSLPIGNISANALNLKLNNTSQRYNPKNTNSDIYPYLKANRAIRPYIGIDCAGVITYFAQGVFYLRELRPGPDMTVEIQAVDRMFFLNEEDFNTSIVYENYLNSALVETLVLDFGLGATEYSIDATTGTIPYAWFEPRRYAENIKRLAIAEGGVAFFDELGILKYKKRGWTSSDIAAYYTDSHILKGSAYSPFVAASMKNYITVKSNPLYKQVQTEVYSLMQSIVVPALSTKAVACYFNKKPCLDIVNATFTQSSTHITVTSESKYSFVTFLTFTNSAAVDENVLTISIQAKPLETTGANVVVSQNANLISIYGKSEYSVDSEFIQDMGYAQILADDLRIDSEDPSAELELSSLSLPYLQLGDLVAVQHAKLNIGWVTKIVDVKSLTLQAGAGTLMATSLNFISTGDDLVYEKVIIGV